MNTQLSEQEQRTLFIIVNKQQIKASDLTRRMHSIGVTDQDERELIIDVLKRDCKYIDNKIEPFALGKRGRRAVIYFATDAGKKAVTAIINNNKKSHL